MSTPRDEGEYVLDVDASLFGAGACLQQWQDGQLKVIAYASRTFNKSERSYCVTRREIAALVFGLKRFKQYLLGVKFTCRTDHSALVYYRKTPEPIGQQCRYLDFIAQFDMDLQYRPGSKHANADCLSRLRPCEINNGEPCRQCNRQVTGHHGDLLECVRRVHTRADRRRKDKNIAMASVDDFPPLPSDPGHSTTATLGFTNRTDKTGLLYKTAPEALRMGVAEWSSEFLAAEQKSDPDIGPIYNHFVSKLARPEWSIIQSGSPMTRALWSQWNSLVMRNDVLYRIFYSCNGTMEHLQIVLPISLKVPFLEIIHADTAGHLKFRKCLDHVQRRAWWLTYRRDVKLFIQCCPACISYHRGIVPRQGRLHSMVIGAPGLRWVIDLTGPFCMSNGQKYIFTAIDPFTKYAIATPIRNKEARTVARAFFENVLLKWGLCDEVLSDLGKEFESEILQELLKFLGVVKLHSTSYKPSTQGVIEVWHKVLNSLLSKVVSETQRDWSKYVSYVVFCYNATEHSSTGFCPHFLMTGQLPRWNIDFLLGDNSHKETSVPEYVDQTLRRLEWAYIETRKQLTRAAESASTWYNRRVKPADFKVGDNVRVYNPRRFKGRTPKWQNFYKDSAVIVKCLNDVTMVVNSKNWRQPKIVHVDKLKKVQSFQ